MNAERTPLLNRRAIAKFRQKLRLSFFLSYGTFVLLMCLDFYITNAASLGDFTQEANLLGRVWWEFAGMFRFLEIPIWAALVFLVAYLITLKNRFLALVWLNMLACSHGLGVLTWLLPFSVFAPLYAFIPYEWAIGYAFSVIGICIGIPLALAQLQLDKVVARANRT